MPKHLKNDTYTSTAPHALAPSIFHLLHTNSVFPMQNGGLLLTSTNACRILSYIELTRTRLYEYVQI